MNDADYALAAYGQLQAKLSRRRHITRYERAIEAAMDQILAGPFPPSRESVDRALPNAERRERYHEALERKFLSDPIDTSDPCAAAEARIDLKKLQSKLSEKNWDIVLSLAQGAAYKDVAGAISESSGALRVKVTRLRHDMREMVKA